MPVTKKVGKKGTTYFIDFYADGKRYRERVGTNKKAAEIKLGKRLKEIEDGTFTGTKPKKSVPFEDLADECEKIAKQKKGYAVTRYYIANVKRYFTGRTVQSINVLDVERFQRDMAERPTKGKRRRSGTDVNRNVGCLRGMLNKAVHWEMIDKNPASKVKDFPEPCGRNKFLTVDEAGRLLDACHPHIRPIVLCALETGMRKSEILGLRWKDIRNEMIYLTGDRTKNGKPREVPVSPRLAAELKKVRRQQTQGDVVDASDIVFKAVRGRPSEDGKRRLKVLPAAVKSFREAWEAAREKAGIDPGFHFHDLRHTFASHQKMAGTDDYTLMDLMGHSDFGMMKRYAHLTPEHKREAIARLPEWKAAAAGQNLDGNPSTDEKGLRTESPQPLVFPGAEGGI